MLLSCTRPAACLSLSLSPRSQGGYGLLVAEACGYPAALVAEARQLQRAVRACFPTLLLTDGGGASVSVSGGHGQGHGQGPGGVDQSHKLARRVLADLLLLRSSATLLGR
jgi:hypothetical protein